MQEPATGSSPVKKRLMLLLKIAITGFCLWYVSTKIDLNATAAALGNANWLWLSAALFLYIISKIISAIRLNINFRNVGLHLSAEDNLRLYWLGMFYNLFLPGSISGDAYKVIILGKRFKTPYKKLTAAVLLDRFSGLAGLGILLGIYGYFVLNERWVVLLLVSGSLLCVLLLYIVIRTWLKDFLAGFGETLALGIAVQALQVIAVYAIMLSLEIPWDHSYIFLFLLSSVASVLPLTIGGLGIREIVFLYGASYFGLQKETAIVISLVFFLITLVSSAFGLLYVFNDPLRDPDKKTGPQ
jgi:glycosyltransferase 2 family protein